MAGNTLISKADALSASRHVLSLPELLSEIFLCSEPRDNASNLLVNKTWAEEVMNVEWRKVYSPELLLRLLAPLELDNVTFQFRFTRPIEAADWKRFDHYAFRVRDLVLEESIFQDSVFVAIGQNQRHTKLLPNLECLTCPVDLSHLKTFAHPNLTYLTLCNLEAQPLALEVIDEVYSFVRETLPTLRVLVFNFVSETGVGSAESLLTFLLGSLKNLEALQIPPQWLSPAVTEAVSTLPSLLSLDTLFLDEDASYSTTPIFSTRMTTESFSCLRILSIAIPFDRAIAGFASWGRSNTLEQLQLAADAFEPTDTIRDVVAVITTTFPLLLVLHIEAATPIIPSGIPKPRFHIESLKPLHKLKKLQDLTIHYTTPLLLGDGDLFLLIHALRDLSILHLNPSPPVWHAASGIHITALSMLAFSQTILSDVALYVDTSLRGFGVIQSGSQDMYRQRIEGLESLSFGYSRLRSEAVDPVVDYLHHVLPKECTVLVLNRGDGTVGADGRLSRPWDDVCSRLRDA
ncbi:hypothetical protein ONZ45_g5355 [Pleurotus djamor]|nr:hypothetical protein ONZ45_g5355 [Pleurotus djamor]